MAKSDAESFEQMS